MQCLLELTPVSFPAESRNVGTIMMKASPMKFLVLKANSRYTRLNFWPQPFNPLYIPGLGLVHFLVLEFRFGLYFRSGSAILNQVLEGDLTCLSVSTYPSWVSDAIRKTTPQHSLMA